MLAGKLVVFIYIWNVGHLTIMVMLWQKGARMISIVNLFLYFQRIQNVRRAGFMHLFFIARSAYSRFWVVSTRNLWLVQALAIYPLSLYFSIFFSALLFGSPPCSSLPLPFRHNVGLIWGCVFCMQWNVHLHICMWNLPVRFPASAYSDFLVP